MKSIINKRKIWKGIASITILSTLFFVNLNFIYARTLADVQKDVDQIRRMLEEERRKPAGEQDLTDIEALEQNLNDAEEELEDFKQGPAQDGSSRGAYEQRYGTENTPQPPTPQPSGTYKPLSGEGAEKILPGTKAGDINTMLQGLYRWGVGIAVLIALIYIVIGGIQYMTTDAIYDKGEGRKRIQNAFFGLIIALSSVLILNTIDERIIKTRLSFEELGTKPPVYTGLNKTPTGFIGGGVNQAADIIKRGAEAVQQGTTLDEMQARSLLEAEGITTNNSGPSDRRTLVGGLADTTRSGLISMKYEMLPTGKLVLTAGNEAGYGGVNHTTSGDYNHSSGYKIDIGKKSNLDNWEQITNYFKSSTNGEISPNTRVYGTIKGTNQKFQLIHETGSAEHYDVLIYPPGYNK